MSRELMLVTTGVWVATSRNYSTTSTIVARDGRALLIDPAWDVDELISLAEAIAELGLVVSSAFHTHAHHDHLLWAEAFGQVPRWATPAAVEMVREHGSKLRTLLGKELEAFVGDDFARIEALPGNEIPAPFGTDGPHEIMEVISHDGHAPGHGALWLPERGLLVAGDMLSDLELPLPFTPEGLSAYLPALDALEPYVDKAQWLIPGHGTPTDRPLQRLQADRNVLEALLRGEDIDDGRRSLPEGEETYRKLKETVDAYEDKVETLRQALIEGEQSGYIGEGNIESIKARARMRVAKNS